jgi:acyl dehydratase
MNDDSKKLYLDDLAVGDSWITGERRVDADQIVAFARDFDPQPFHLDAEQAKGTYFGGLAASGWHTAALTMGMLVTDGLPFADGVIGGGAELAWPSATRPGDVLHVEAVIESIVPSRSKPDRGMVTVRSQTLTADGEVRQVFTAKLLVFRRAGASA